MHGLNEELKMIKGSIRDFAIEVLKPGARDWEEGKRLAKGGILSWPIRNSV